MRKIPFSKLVRGAMIAVTLAAIAIVFIRNMFPPLDDMIVLDNIQSVSYLTGGMYPLAESSNVESDGSSNNSLSGGFPSSTFKSSSGNILGMSDVSSNDLQSAKGSASCSVSKNDKININTASVSELTSLIGIGETRAKAIVEYREVHGDFSSIDDLVLVSGIGEKTLEKNRDLITV